MPWNHLIKTMLTVVLLGPLAGQAATTTWNLSWTTDCISSGCGGWDTSRTYEDTSSSDNVIVRSFIATNGGTITQGQVNSWNGLGAKKFGEGDTQPYHAVDNRDGEYEAILFDFGAGNLVSLNSLSIGYFSNDADISVLAYAGGVDPVSNWDSWGNLLTNGWNDVAMLSDVQNWPGDTATFNESNTVYSRYWLIGAYNSVLHDSTAWSCSGPCNRSRGTDVFKLSQVAGVVGGGNDVPEPAILLLMTLGLGIIGTRRRFAKS